LNQRQIEILGMAEQDTGERQKEQVGSEIFEHNPDRGSYQEGDLNSSKNETKKKTKEAKIEAKVEITEPCGHFTDGKFADPGSHGKIENNAADPTNKKSLPGLLPLDSKKKGNKRNPR